MSNKGKQKNLRTVVLEPEDKTANRLSVSMSWLILGIITMLLIAMVFVSDNFSSPHFWVSVVGALFLVIFSSTLLVSLQWEKRKRREDLQRDFVTGTYRYRAFRDIVRATLDSAEASDSYAYAHINLGRFRLVNDVFGYEEGDRILRTVARAIAGNLKDGELFCRVYADHFVLFLRGSSTRADLSARLEAVFDRFPKVPEAHLGSASMTVNCGVYEIEDTSIDVNAINERANIACNDAVESGRRILFYEKQMLYTLMDEHSIEAGMEKALGDSQFVLYLQPIYNLHDKTIIGAEALVRWRHPVRGLLYPDQFLPTLERTGFIRKVDLYMFESVCKLLRTWIDTGRPVVPISVNLSRIHLDDIHLVPMLTSLITFYRVPASLLELEITENSFREDEKVMLSLFHQLKRAGFSVAMDDFGTGYSTLNILKDIPLDTLKLDKRFLEQSVNTERGRSVVRDVVSMARHLNMKVVCEGIETENQLKFLASVGGERGQGYFFSRPIPVMEFENMVENRVGLSPAL